jgi:hypothetical protein
MCIGCDEAQVAHIAHPTERTFYMKSNRYYYFKVLRIGNNYEGGYTRVERTEF